MRVYYNEFDEEAAAWLKVCADQGIIPAGDIDTRSITEVSADDLIGYDQCHFFAGIGTWAYALIEAGWDQSIPVWTGSCPCQPFSAAGQGQGFDDERHLWPVWHRLIRERRPTAVFGEQVAAKAGLAWLDLVQADLEDEGYAAAAFDLCAAGVGSPHIRQRLWIAADIPSELEAVNRGLNGGGQPVADRSVKDGLLVNAAGERLAQRRSDTAPRSSQIVRPQGFRSACMCAPTDRGSTSQIVADASCQTCARDAGEFSSPQAGVDSARQQDGRVSDGLEPCGTTVNAVATGCERIDPAAADDIGRNPDRPHVTDYSSLETRLMGDTLGAGLEGYPWHGDETSGWALAYRPTAETSRHYDYPDNGLLAYRPYPGPVNGHWRRASWVPCSDGKARPTEPSTSPMAYGPAAYMGRLRGYGNGIVAPLAIEFIKSYMEARNV